MIDTMIGVDLAKNVFQLHGASLTGEVMRERGWLELLFAKQTAHVRLPFMSWC